MDIKFRVISDMVRFESGKPNYEAGIDLLEHFYNIKGYSISIMIFCADYKKGRENAEKRNIRKDRLYAITKYGEDVVDFADF